MSNVCLPQFGHMPRAAVRCPFGARRALSGALARCGSGSPTPKGRPAGAPALGMEHGACGRKTEQGRAHPADGLGRSGAAVTSSTAAPLAGLRVVDASRVLAGPFCTMLLADLGADVIKVERPCMGDETHSWGPPFVEGAGGDARESTYYLSINRNKRSLTLDLSVPAGRAVLHRLVAGADVFVENFRPGTQAALGADYETLAALNRRLVYCSISGFGPVGPERDRPGYDLLMQGFTGLMSITGEAGREPVRAGVAVIDLATGTTAVGAILGALLARDRLGRGQRVDLSLMATGVSWMTYAAQSYFATGRQPRPLGSGHPNLVPYQAFRGGDDQWFLVAVGNDEQWRRCCGVLGVEYAEDDRFRTNAGRVTHRADLVELLGRLFATAPAVEWIARLTAAGIPAGPVHTLADLFAHPQVIAAQLVQYTDHQQFGKLPTLRSPFRFSETPLDPPFPPPALGQHTDEILGALGYDAQEISRLHADGVV